MVSALLAFMSITGLAGMYNIRKLSPGIIPPGEIFAGTPAPFRLTVKNGTRYLPSFLISLKYLSAEPAVFPMIQPHSSCEGAVMLTFDRRGIIPGGRITVSSPYPVGFFSRYWTFEVDTHFTVFPALTAGQHSAASDKASFTGTVPLRERGFEGELEQIYPYSGSEPLRAIHWKLSARSHELMVKSFGSNACEPLFIDVANLPGQGTEERISRAAWLVWRLVNERPVGLVLGERVIPADSGKQHGYKLLTELALYGAD